jgi:hypothetical protein
MRIGLIGDTHGFLPALETAIQGCRKANTDIIIHCGDFLSVPFSPDPPDEIIALLRSEAIRVIYGNSEIYLRDWNTDRWERTVKQRMRRPDSPEHFLPLVAAGQEALSAQSLAWLRELPGELLLDCARPGDVYVCHGMPGDPFSTIWDGESQYTPDFGTGEIDAVLSRPEVANADLILCGHVPYPLVQHINLPNNRAALVIRGVGWIQGTLKDTEPMVDYWILENSGPISFGYKAWEFQRHVRSFRLRNPIVYTH